MCAWARLGSPSLLPNIEQTLHVHVMSTIVANCTDLENWNGTDRHHFNAIVADQDLIEVLVC